ncbi:MAG: beta-galactosidase [Phycisphaeraceae bacterium]
MKWRGVAYYPEYWPASRWKHDIQLMADAGINAVRLCEFAWSRLEPHEGQFSLGWLESAVAMLWDKGIAVVMGTPTAAPPAWLAMRYPHSMRVDEFGRRARHGGRRNCCPTSPDYADLTTRVVAQLAKAFATHEAIVGWQIDNEPSSMEPCYCEQCLASFRQWIRHRYGTIEAVNNAWGAVFWSGELTDFAQIDPRCDRLTWRLDFRRFTDQAQARCIHGQAAQLRAAGVRQPITTNVWAGLNPGIDVAQMFDSLDAVGVDVYWNYYADRYYYSAQMDYMRQVAGSKPLWIMETGAWNHDSISDEGLATLRPWAYAMLARGADAMFYFRWRQSPMGEHHHAAVLDWSGLPAAPYQQVKTVCRELREVLDRLGDLPPPRRAQVAILHDYEVALCAALEQQRGFERVAAMHGTLNRMHISADILPAARSVDLSHYKVLILPRLQMVDQTLRKVITAYVHQGGVVLAQTSLATRDRNGKFLTEPEAIGLGDLFGVHVTERCQVLARRPDRLESGAVDLDRHEVHLVGDISSPLNGTAVDTMEQLIPIGEVRVLARYESGRFKGGAAITRRTQGRGVAIYQGCWMDQASSAQLLRWVVESAGVSMPPDAAPGVEILQRGAIRFYLNQSDRPVSVPAVRPGRVVLGTFAAGNVQLSPWDVCILNESDAIVAPSHA